YLDTPYLATDETNWQATRVWLHKPILPPWQIALSYLVFGVNSFALRLPSALLSTAAVWLTYAIGRELIDRLAGLIAAALQAFNPAILMLVHGYVFSDHVDISLLFWTELGIWLVLRTMRSGSWRDAVLAGVAQGLALLSKTYPALIVSMIAAAAWVLPLIIGDRRWRFFRGRFVAMLAATLVTAGPWFASCAARFPREFIGENTKILSHLTANVENWAAPWD